MRPRCPPMLSDLNEINGWISQVEEFYVITWDAKKEQIFEMPTGGAAIMRKGPNLLKLARKVSQPCHPLLP